jgi:hypothetical protein
MGEDQPVLSAVVPIGSLPPTAGSLVDPWYGSPPVDTGSEGPPPLGRGAPCTFVVEDEEVLEVFIFS